jgi:hypothetical protein
MPTPSSGQLTIVAVVAVAASAALGALAAGRLTRRSAAELVRWE